MSSDESNFSLSGDSPTSVDASYVATANLQFHILIKKKKKLAYLILELVQGVGGDYGRGGVEPLHRHSSELGQVGEVDGPECAPA